MQFSQFEIRVLSELFNSTSLEREDPRGTFIRVMNRGLTLWLISNLKQTVSPDPHLSHSHSHLLRIACVNSEKTNEQLIWFVYVPINVWKELWFVFINVLTKEIPWWRWVLFGLKNLDNLAVKKLIVIIRRLLDIITMMIHNNFLLGGIKAKKI